MTKTTLSLTLITIAATLDAAPKTEPPAEPLTVRLYNYAGIEVALLEEAASLAQEIYSLAGVETVWIRCRVSLDEPVYDPSCTETPGPDVIRMRIMDETPDHIAGVNHVAFGFALPARGKGKFGTAASVFWDRISETAARSKVTDAALLAAVMAHEAGHLLLGFNGHSQQGLMAARWDEAQMTKISHGGMRFIGKQKKIAAASVRERLAANRR